MSENPLTDQQTAGLEQRLSELEARLAKTRARLEKAEAELAQRTAERDQALSRLQASSDHFERTPEVTGNELDFGVVRYQEELLQKLFERIPVMITMFSPDTNVTQVNRACEQLIGWSNEELREIDLMEKVYPDPEYRARVAAFMQSLEEGWRDFEITTKDGQILESSWTNFKLSDDTFIGIGIDIRERKRAELAELQMRLMDSVEAERSMLARELHDGPMQEIYAVTYQIAAMSSNPNLSEEIRRELQEIKKRLVEINQTLRNTSRDLLPPSLASFGLEKTIRDHINLFRRSHPEIEVRSFLEPDGQQLPESVRLALFRIYQIAVTNIIRHAEASSVEIRLAFQNDHIVQEIRDNGCGFQLPEHWIEFARKGHLGLIGARERAAAIGGKLEVQTQPKRGTLLRVVVPYSQEE